MKYDNNYSYKINYHNVFCIKYIIEVIKKYIQGQGGENENS